MQNHNTRMLKSLLIFGKLTNLINGNVHVKNNADYVELSIMWWSLIVDLYLILSAGSIIIYMKSETAFPYI